MQDGGADTPQIANSEFYALCGIDRTLPADGWSPPIVLALVRVCAADELKLLESFSAKYRCLVHLKLSTEAHAQIHAIRLDNPEAPVRVDSFEFFKGAAMRLKPTNG